MNVLAVYHGTDIEGLNRILKEHTLRGDPSAPFGVGLCSTITRARNFVCIKTLSNTRRPGYTRRAGRIIKLVVDESLLENATPEATGDAFTLNKNGSYLPLRALSFDDPLVLSFEVLTLRQQEKPVREEFKEGRT